jgi:hypothetical protein
MELVMPKKPVVIRVDTLLRGNFRRKTCADSWELMTSVYFTYTNPI